MASCTDLNLGKLLHAYELGILSVAEVELFEVHLMECSNCWEKAKSFQNAAELLRADPQVRSAADKVAKEAIVNSPGLLARLHEFLFADSRTGVAFRPVAVAITCLSICVLTYVGTKFGLSQQPSLMANWIKQPTAMTLREGVSRGPLAKVQIQKEHPVILVVIPSSISYPKYRAVIYSLVDSNMVWNSDSISSDNVGSAVIVVPPGRLAEGQHTLRLTAADTTKYDSTALDFEFFVEWVRR